LLHNIIKALEKKNYHKKNKINMKIDKTLKDNKIELLSYYRDRANELLSEIMLIYGITQYKEKASAINTSLIETKIIYWTQCFKLLKKNSGQIRKNLNVF